MRRRIRPALAWLGVAMLLGTVAAAAPPATAQQRRVVVVGDSIVLGAQGPMVAGFAGRGWDITFDATVSRSTTDALTAVESHRPMLSDSVVLSFGANDSGNPAAFRQRVDQLLDAVAGVPHVYWLTIREVRDYYGPANQVLRDAAAARPNVTVVDWHAASAGRTDLTASDGLHLSGAGAAAMSDLVLRAVVDGAAPAPAVPVTEPPPPPPPATVAPPPEPTAPAPPSTVPSTTAATTTAPTTMAPTTTVPPTTAVRAGAVEEAADTGLPGGLEGIRALGLTLGAAVLVVLAALGVSGVLLGGWAIASVGRIDSAPGDEASPDPSQS